MKSSSLLSVSLACVLQALPLVRIITTVAPPATSGYAIVSTWIAGAAVLLGGYHAVSGASTTITSPSTARGTNGVPFSYRITTGPDAANTFSAVPLPTGLTCGTSNGRITGTPLQDGVFNVLLTASDGGRPSRTVTKNLTLTIVPGDGGTNPPSILVQPVNRTATNGGIATFTVAAGGTGPLRYQWRANGTDLIAATNATLTLSGVTTSNAGSYAVVVTNNYGSVTSVTAVLTVLVPPGITSQPESLTVMAGSNAVLGVTATGTAPLRYQWRKQGAAIGGATNLSLSFAPAALINAGNYTVVIANAAGAVTSAVATLTVNSPPVPDLARPAVTVLSPAAALTLVSSNSINLLGTATDNQGVTSVFIQQNGTTAPASGTNNWSATAALVPGTNTFRVWATDAAGNLSLTNTRVVIHVVKLPLALAINGAGTVSGATNGQLLELGKSYALKAVARPGNVFSNWLVNGQPSAGAVLSFGMASNLAVTANFVTNPFIALKGSYSGLFYPNAPEPPHEQSGYFTLTVTEKGSFSARLLLAGASYSASGLLDLSLAGSRTILRKGTNDILLQLHLDAESDEVSGVVSNEFWSSDLFGHRALFHSRLNPATNIAGKYTLLLSGGEDAASSPAGQSPVTLDLATAGTANLKGTLADGTAFAQKTSVATNGQTPVYASLYKGRGSLIGWLTVTDSPTNDTPGLLLWTKKDSALPTMYPGGFTNETMALGSRYHAPASRSAALAWSNGVALLESGNLLTPLTNDVALSYANKFFVTSTNTHKLALSLTTSAGTIGGSFVHPDTLRKSTIKGVILQKQQLGGGFFLGTNQSGVFQLGESSAGNGN